MTHDQIRQAVSDQAPTEEEVQRFADILTSSLDNLSPRDAVAVMHAALELALHIGDELGADDRKGLLAVFLLRECDADAAAAQRAVRQAKAQADASVAALLRRGQA